ncbi:MmcQ/YjbR family DNA-binding protein [Microlunatus sp. Gsoil 973]|uniref:MmcQ/YjbR family DNA-binding protein n=1 Tax=Microlunatus sp. Gsoil 973 TaxID=2672569 RepID=UPI0018A7EBB2|nr:MmcQ/YjbR family DNA-binding protein [Microlunatus sp. Gsoil 973]
MTERPEIPAALLRRLDQLMQGFPDCYSEEAWVGIRWRVRNATVAHLFGGEDGRFRITFRAEPEEVTAFEHLGPPYFRADWGSNVVGMTIERGTDWAELTELLTDSYCLQAPAGLARQVSRPSV